MKLDQKRDCEAFALRDGHIPELDGLRAISILMVMLGHAGMPFVPAAMGVTIFFAISGYLICGLLIDELHRDSSINLPKFYIRRMLRLYPELICYFLILLLASALLSWKISWAQVLAGIFYFTNYIQIFGNIQNSISYITRPLWSLAVEEHFYLLFPLFVIGMRGNTRRMAATLSLLMIFILGWRIVALTWWHPPRFYLDYATESRIDAIAGGCLISCAFKEQTAHRIRAIMTTQGRKVLVSALAILCAAVLIRNPFFRETGRYTLESIGSMVLVLAVVYAENTNSFVRKFLRNKIMTFIGKTSYAAYLYHLFIYQILTMLLPSSSFIWIFLAVLISLSAATASFYLVEKPLKPLRRRFGSHVRG